MIRAETVLPPGQSGFVPTSGTNPHLTDQLALYQSFAFKPAGFDLPGATETPFAGVTITRDAYGVPNVRAGNDRDLWKGVGYAMAQDRLVQLELFRRATQGRLAELLGPDRLESDIVARRDYYTPRELQRTLNRLPRSLQARFDAYADGVNAWIAKVAADPSKQPLEFAALQLRCPRGAPSTRRRSACSSRGRSPAATATSSPTGRRSAGSAPSASSPSCRCGARARSRRSPRPRAASRRRPAAPARTSASASSARRGS